jgi:23S rRNA pseudouridine2457 synthase
LVLVRTILPTGFYIDESREYFEEYQRIKHLARDRLESYIRSMSKSGTWHCILFNKPYGVLSQFTGAPGQQTLAEFGPFPEDVYAAGRLDADSEGLLLLTNDPQVQRRITDPVFAHPRIYAAQVENIPTEEALSRLCRGVEIDGRMTLPAEVKLLSSDPGFPPRSVPIRYRKNIPTAWIEITLREGRNRQVRRMTAAVGFPTLRLVRVSMGPFDLTGLAPGEAREITTDERKMLFRILRLTH